MKWIVAALGLTVGLAASACAPVPEAPREFTGVIGIAGPMSGPYATFGDQMHRGAEQAVADLNAAGGVLGKKLVLESVAARCEPRRAVSVANQLVKKGAVFVVGHFCSSSSIPASEVYNDEGVIQISPASTNPLLTERGLANVFRTSSRDDLQGQFAGNFIADHFADKRIAIVHDKQAYSKGQADETKKQLNKRGIEEVLYDTITAGKRDYLALVNKLKAKNVEVLYYGGYPSEGGLIVRQMREQGLNARLISDDALIKPEFWSIAGDTGEGTLITFGSDPRDNPAANSVVAKFRATGHEPVGYTLYSYGAIQVWAQAVDEVGSTDVDALSKALKSGQFDTVLGRIGFDEKGDVTLPGWVMYEWKKGRLDYVHM